MLILLNNRLPVLRVDALMKDVQLQSAAELFVCNLDPVALSILHVCGLVLA